MIRRVLCQGRFRLSVNVAWGRETCCEQNIIVGSCWLSLLGVCVLWLNYTCLCFATHIQCNHPLTAARHQPAASPPAPPRYRPRGAEPRGSQSTTHRTSAAHARTPTTSNLAPRYCMVPRAAHEHEQREDEVDDSAIDTWATLALQVGKLTSSALYMALGC